MKNLFGLFVLLSFLLIAGCATKEKPMPTPAPAPEPAPVPQPAPQPAPQPLPEPKETGNLLIAVTDNPLKIDKANCDFELKKFEIELKKAKDEHSKCSTFDTADKIKCNICNVGITIKQRNKIISLLKYGQSINGFVRKAVEKELRLK